MVWLLGKGKGGGRERKGRVGIFKRTGTGGVLTCDVMRWKFVVC